MLSVHTHTYIYSHIAKACAASGDAVRVRELHDDPSSRSCVFEWSSNDIFHKQSSGSLIMEATTLEATAPATTNTVSNSEPSLSTHRASVVTIADI